MMLVDMHGHSRKNDVRVYILGVDSGDRARTTQVFFYGCVEDWKGKMKRLRDLHRQWVIVGLLKEIKSIKLNCSRC